ncbi:MAG: UbiA prenyltransferase family protein [Catenulispora sp.]|nr:UbiA prenyltransferase family protein [Catenulispora sp.]
MAVLDPAPTLAVAALPPSAAEERAEPIVVNAEPGDARHLVPVPLPAAVPRRSAGQLTRDLVALIRPAHWAKSALVVPIALLDITHWTLGAFGGILWSIAAFVLASSAVYVGNDIADRHRDRHHPVKRLRPIASGRVPVPVAVGYCTALCGLLALFLFTGPLGFAWPVLGYLVLNVAYSRGLKHVPLIEAGAVAAGFVLRVLQGYVATGRPAPGWLLVTVFTGCLMLVVGKRRQELLEAGAAHRPSLRGYTVELAGHLLQLTGGLTIVSGLLYVQAEAPFGPYGLAATLISVPFALFTMSRYLQMVLVYGGGGDPVRVLLGDRRTVIATLLWAAALAVTILLARYPTVLPDILP